MFKKKKEKEEFIDDGRTVADMNIDGMPWYTERKNDSSEHIELTKEESRAFSSGVLKATILVASVFAVGYFLFILFCVKVWFR